MGSVASIDLSLANIWHCWYAFRRGKKRTYELDLFSYFLEGNFFKLQQDLAAGIYQHGKYRSFRITDTKKRTISVASIRDRVAHRLVYEYLVSLFDPIFIYDAWSCRKNKGLLGAITRTQKALKKHRNAFVWRTDIVKFFDSIDHEALKARIGRKVNDPQALLIINEIIVSYASYSSGKGIPIGNLTSQIFTNIYLHELDFYILHVIKPLFYIRYGDDFLVITENIDHLKLCREHLTVFLDQELELTVHAKNSIIVPVKYGVYFLGCDIYPTGKRLRKRVYNRIGKRLNFINSSSYRSLVLMHGKRKVVKWLDWKILDIMKGI